MRGRVAAVCERRALEDFLGGLKIPGRAVDRSELTQREDPIRSRQPSAERGGQVARGSGRPRCFRLEDPGM